MIGIGEVSTKYSLTTLVNQTLKEDGQMSGTVATVFSNYARNRAMHLYGGHQEEYIKENIKDKTANIAIDSFAFENLDNDTLALQQNFAFNTGAAQTGEYTFVPINSFSDYFKNPFSKNTRFSNINFGYKQSIKLVTVTHIPENKTVDALPKNVSLSNPSKSMEFTRFASISAKNTITTSISINISESWVDVKNYPEMREFYKQMIDFMNEQVVLKSINK